jgi:hypothetical protein
MIKIAETGGKIRVESPYNPECARRMRAAGGKWDSAGKAWVLDARALDAVRDICREIYGEDDRGGERVTLRVTFLRTYIADRGPCVLAGRTLASAWGRDSGARVGDGLSFVKGAPRSGGSVKNWDTRIPEGSVVDIYDVPLPMARETIDAAPSTTTYLDEPIYTAEIMGAPSVSIDRAALEAERVALVARLAEIDALLPEVV